MAIWNSLNLKRDAFSEYLSSLQKECIMAVIEEEDNKLVVNLGDVTAYKDVLKYLSDIEVLLKCKLCEKQYKDVASFLRHMSTNQCKCVLPHTKTSAEKADAADSEPTCRTDNDSLLIKREDSSNQKPSEGQMKRRCLATSSVVLHRLMPDEVRCGPSDALLKSRETADGTPSADRPGRRRCSAPKYLGDYVTSSALMDNVKKEPEHAESDESVPQVVTPAKTGRKRKASPARFSATVENVISLHSRKNYISSKVAEQGTSVNMVSILKKGPGRPKKNTQNSGVLTVSAQSSGSSKTTQKDGNSDTFNATNPTHEKRGRDSITASKPRKSTQSRGVSTDFLFDNNSGNSNSSINETIQKQGNDINNSTVGENKGQDSNVSSSALCRDRILDTTVPLRKLSGRPRKQKVSDDFEYYEAAVEKKARVGALSSQKVSFGSQSDDSAHPSIVPQTTAQTQKLQDSPTGTRQHEQTKQVENADSTNGSDKPSGEINRENPAEGSFDSQDHDNADMDSDDPDQNGTVSVSSVNNQDIVKDKNNEGMVQQNGNADVVGKDYEMHDGKFKCSKCQNELFDTSEDLSFHLECHYKNGFYCLSCGYSSPHWNHLFEHMLGHKSLRNQLKNTEMGKKCIGEFTCPLCPEKFILKHYLRNHINSVHNQFRMTRKKEPTDGEPTKKKKKYKKKLSKGDIGEFYKCPHCKRRYFASLEEMTYHLKFHVATDLTRYKCIDSGCEYQTSYWERMMEHIVSHPHMIAGLKGTKMLHERFTATHCKQCNKKFRSSILLKCHVSKVHNKKDFVCSVCEKTLEKIDIKTFQRHVEKCTNIANGTKLSCEHCKYQTLVSRDLKLHMRIHEGRGFTCEKCGRMFANKSQLQQHQRVHEENRDKYMCEYCAQNFISTKSLEAHIVRNHEDGHTVYKCPQCKFVAKLEIDITRHVKYVHEGKFKCSECPYSTNLESSFKQHEVYHQADRIFPCTEPNCYYRGRTTKQLCDHKSAVHNSKKIFRCKICSKTYKKLVHLKRHLVFHTGDHPYTCYYCGQKFQCHARYYRHMREHKAKGDTPVEQHQVEIPHFHKMKKLYYEETPSVIHHKDIITLNDIKVKEENSPGTLQKEQPVGGDNSCKLLLENIEATPVNTLSEEYEAVRALTDKVYHQSAGSQGGATSQDSVMMEKIVVSSGEEIDMLTQHAQEIVNGVRQQLLIEDGQVEVVGMRDSSVEEYTVILNAELTEDGSVIELPEALPTEGAEGGVHLGHSQVVEVSTGENQTPQYAILMLEGTEK